MWQIDVEPPYKSFMDYVVERKKPL